ncbi:hypothetical protein [Falsiroseomonas tokyonensis]|uniref:Uncharacterized protein n=1 Tax=Falsiroseomonas tokyonensis TaxID=430521 RepID=A0ABV7C1T2_9PROT|nr:hypothetical protein [Falsiroseomonas tokyonensis]MBU8541429.1 hypothetical protein [Falsiroseomonas tokyonensis]
MSRGLERVRAAGNNHGRHYAHASAAVRGLVQQDGTSAMLARRLTIETPSHHLRRPEIRKGGRPDLPLRGCLAVRPAATIGLGPAFLVMTSLAMAEFGAMAALWSRYDPAGVDHDHVGVAPKHPHPATGRRHAEVIDDRYPQWPC